MNSYSSFLSSAGHWLMSPMSGATEHQIAMHIAWHARLMVLSWGILSPLMIVIARYFKVTPNQNWPSHLDNPFWFLTHRRSGYWIVAIASCGLIAAVWGGRMLSPLGSLHAALGWTLFGLGWLQVIGSRARGSHGGPMNPFTRMPRSPAEWPGDHFSMTKRRIIFEYTHKTLGWLLQFLSMAAILTGLRRADALNWMWVSLLIWWISIMGLCSLLQAKGRCVDTYQAIWGIAPELPGNLRSPIGWGVRRYTSESIGRSPWAKETQMVKRSDRDTTP